MRALSSRFLPLSLAIGLAALSGCTVGPDYKGPPADAASLAQPAFARADTPPQPAAARWWEALGDPRLNGLVEAALARSPTIAEAEAHIREAGAVLRQRQAAGLPTASPSVMYAHARLPAFSSGGSGSTLNIFDLSGTASWEPDFWGEDRRNRESARATIGQRLASLADAQVSLSAQVAQAYVNLRDAQTRLALTQTLAGRQQQALDLIGQRRAGGTASQLDVEQARNQLQQSLAQIAPLQAQAEVSLNQLAILTGQAPGALDHDLAAGEDTALPHVPAQVNVGDPASLIARRPDIREAERALAASNADIGAARAKLLPTLSFTGILGLGGMSAADMVDPAMLTAGLLPQLKWTGLDWGKARATVHQKEASRDAAEAQYRQSILKALEDAESSLSRFGGARVRLGHVLESETAARHSEALNRERLAAGLSSQVEQIDREGQRLQASIASAQARAELSLDYIAVQKALGLGWQPVEAAS